MSREVKPPASLERKDQDWLSSLHPADKAIAIRWLNEPGGEARLRRIADVITKRPRGAPKKSDSRSNELDRAAALYVTIDGLTRTEAVGRIWDQLDPKPISKTGYTNQQAKALGELPATMLREIALKTANDGQHVRADLFPDIAAMSRLHAAVLRTLHNDSSADRLLAFQNEIARTSTTPLVKSIKDRMKAASEQLERHSRIYTFCDAFPDLKLDDLPVTTVDAFFCWVEGVATDYFRQAVQHKK